MQGPWGPAQRAPRHLWAKARTVSCEVTAGKEGGHTCSISLRGKAPGLRLGWQSWGSGDPLKSFRGPPSFFFGHPKVHVHRPTEGDWAE